MIVIFNFSAQVAEESQELSSGITEVIIETVEKIAPDTRINHGVLSHYVRKNAHFIAYFILGILSTNALYLNGIYNKKAFSIGLLISVIYAITDEIHQLFVPGRAGRILDVIIDSSGALVGIILYILLFKLIEKKKKDSVLEPFSLFYQQYIFMVNLHL